MPHTHEGHVQMTTNTCPGPRKITKPRLGLYRPVHPASDSRLYHRRMHRTLVDPTTPRWMLHALGYDRHLLR